MANLAAKDLKTKGVAAIEAVLAERPEAIVSVRGKDRFLVDGSSHYWLFEFLDVPNSYKSLNTDSRS